MGCTKMKILLCLPQAQNVMRSTVNVIDTITETLVDGKEEGDPDSVIQKDEISISASTLSAAQMINSTNVTSLQGSVVLPPIDELFTNGTPSCIDRKVWKFSFMIISTPFYHMVF